MKRRDLILWICFYISANILLISLLVYLNAHPDVRLSRIQVLLLCLFLLPADILLVLQFFHFVQNADAKLYQISRLRQNEKLLRPYLTCSQQQKKTRNELHDILNAQFSYYSLLNDGSTEEAERFRNRTEERWRKEASDD